MEFALPFMGPKASSGGAGLGVFDPGRSGGPKCFQERRRMGYFAITLEHDEKEKEKFIEGLRRNPVLELRGMGGIGRNKRG